MNQQEMEQSLRAMLVERARSAPNGDLLAEQIIATAGSASVTDLHTHRRRAWTMPLLAAAAVAAVVAGTLSLTSLRPTSSDHHSQALVINPGTSTGGTILPTTGSMVAPVSVASIAPGTSLQAFHAYDLSFANGITWALGSADCLNGSGDRCTALLRSTDKGATWSMNKATPFNLPDYPGGCKQLCVDHVRFANAQVGYVYSQSTMEMTRDGGKTWFLFNDGGADALETLDNNVIRVTDQGGCPPGCTYQLQTSAIGSEKFKTVTAPIPGMNGVGVQLSRNGHNAYLLLTQNPAGGAGSAKSTLLSSTNDGASWTLHDEICPQSPDTATASGEIDSTAMTAAGDGSVVIVCTPRQESPTATAFVEVSTDGAASFHTANKTAISAATGSTGTVAAASANNICVSMDVLMCSSDGGKTFSRPQGPDGEPGQVTWIGFESPTLGHAIEIENAPNYGPITHLWTTNDAGVSWTSAQISS